MDPLTDALAQTAFVTMGELQRLAAEHDLSLTQLRVCGILRDRRLRMTALADYLGLEKSTMTGLVARAEKRGLLERAPSAEDGRAVEVFLSEAGKALAAQLTTKMRAALAPLVAHLGTADQRRLLDLLQRLLGDPT